MTASSSSACSCSAVTAFRAGSAGSAAARRGPGRRSIPRFVREASRPPAGQTTPPDRGARARPRLRRARSESTSMTVHVGYDRYIAELTLIRIGPGMARPPRVQSDAVPALSRGLCRTFADTPCARPYSPAAGSDSCRPVNSCRREGRHRVTRQAQPPLIFATARARRAGPLHHARRRRVVSAPCGFVGAELLAVGGRDDDHRADRVLGDQRADRPHHQPAEPARSARADDQHVRILGRVDQLFHHRS